MFTPHFTPPALRTAQATITSSVAAPASSVTQNIGSAYSAVYVNPALSAVRTLKPSITALSALSSARSAFAYSHLPAVLQGLSPARKTDASESIQIDFALKPRNAGQIQPLLDSLSNPSSPEYGHYLTQAQFRSQFGPTQDEIDQVVAYAKAQGLTVTHVSPSGLYVHATGTAAQMESAFGVKLLDYVSPDPRDHGRIFHAPDREPTVDATVAPLLTGVLGLSNAAVPHSSARKVTDNAIPASRLKSLLQSAASHRAASTAVASARMIAPAAVTANSSTGTVTGTVVNGEGTLVSGATVDLTNDTTNAVTTVTTNANGVFTASGVAAGTYTPDAYAEGYDFYNYDTVPSSDASTITVTSGHTTTVDFAIYLSLTPGGTQTVYQLGSALQSYPGTGQVLGLVEYDTYYASDISQWESDFDLTSTYPSIVPVSVDGFSTATTPGDGEVEVELDIDMMLTLAYGASQIRVYEQANGNGSEAEMFDAIANDSTPPTVVSSSWGDSELDYAASDVQGEASALQQLALQGETVCAASGDDGAYDDATHTDPGATSPNVDDPGSQPTVVCAGGTDLVASFTDNGNVGTLGSQSSWFVPDTASEGAQGYGDGGGGGISEFWSIPSWQKGAFSASVNTQGSATMRNVPDVSLYADGDTGGYFVYVTDASDSADTGYNDVAGTSAAAPLWAAMLADANTERIAKGLPVLGYALPAIYKLAESSHYGTDFYDVKDSSTNGYYKAVTGYDNSTGWGTAYNGTQLITDLSTQSATADFTLTLSAASATGGSSVTGTITLFAPAAEAETFTLTSSNTSGATVPSTLTVAAGGTTATFAVTTKAVTTATSVTVTATYSGTSATASLTVNASSGTTGGSSTRFDFNKDGHADLVWYNTGTGGVSVWDMDDQSVLSYGATFTQLAPSSGWVPVATPDINGDGYPDLLWWNKNTGELSFWTLQNTTVLHYYGDFATVADTDWKPVAAADVTGTTWELVFQNTATGAISAWDMNGQTVTSYGPTLATLGANTPYQVVGAPDLDGDGKSDLLFWDSQTGGVSYWSCNLAGSQVLSYHSDFTSLSDTSWHLVGSEDTNGDGHSDLLWWNAGTGEVSRWLLSGTTVTQYGGETAKVPDTTWSPTAIR